MPSRPRTRRRMALSSALVAAVLLGCTTSDEEPSASVPTHERGDHDGPAALIDASQEQPMLLHRTPTCGCCGGYAEELIAAGVQVQEVEHEDLTHIRSAFGVPDDQLSCHTGQIGGYAVEGHVPPEAIDQLLRERPAVGGIALAGMPSGSPGMPGEQTAPFVVTLIDDGQVVGELGRF